DAAHGGLRVDRALGAVEVLLHGEREVAVAREHRGDRVAVLLGLLDLAPRLGIRAHHLLRPAVAIVEDRRVCAGDAGAHGLLHRAVRRSLARLEGERLLPLTRLDVPRERGGCGDEHEQRERCERSGHGASCGAHAGAARGGPRLRERLSPVPPDGRLRAMATDPEGEGGEPVEVPLDTLSPAALRGVIEAFVLREGTDYGERERTLEEKVADVRRQLARGEARIVFDPATESVDIVPARPPRARR